MRAMSNAVKQILAGEPSPAFLVEIIGPLMTLRYTTAPIDISVPGLGMFINNNNLNQVEAPRLSETVDREPYKLTFIDSDGVFRDLFESGMTGASVTVWAIFLNTTENVLNGFAPNEYLANVDDLLVAYGGTVDTHGVSLEPASGAIVATIEGASPVAALGMTRAVTTSKEYIKQANPADNSFDQVFEDGVRLPWGKI